MRVLITGAGGTLGTALAPLLADAGHEPVVQDVQPIHTPYEFIQGDVRNPADMHAAVRGVDVIGMLLRFTGFIYGTTPHKTFTT